MTAIDPGLTVAQVVRTVPRAAAVLLRRGMWCAGCVMAPFETLREVAATYRQELSGLLAELAEAADSPEGEPR